MNQYEGMFLIDPTFGSSFENCETEIRRVLDRAEAEIILCRRWDERRLAYSIKGRKRGIYALVYFKAAAEKIAGLERDVHLSENILRALILRADGLTLDVMERFAKTHGEAAATALDDADKAADDTAPKPNDKTETPLAEAGVTSNVVDDTDAGGLEKNPGVAESKTLD